jgi:hypothetical protein
MKFTSNGRGGIGANLLAAAALLTFFSCSSTPPVEPAVQESASFCSNLAFRKKYEFLTHSYAPVSKGTFVDQVGQYSDSMSKHLDALNSQFVQIISTRYFDNSSTEQTIESWDPTAKQVIDMSDAGGFRVAWIGGNDFVAWNASVYPKLNVNRGRDVISVDSGRCSTFYGSFTRSDGTGCNNSTFAPNRTFPKQGLLSFILDSKFNLGQFLVSHYYSVPESEQADLCRKAGFPDDCFASPKVTSEQPFDPLKMCAACVRPASFGLLSHGKQLDGIIDQSAHALDLILKASTHVSKKIEGDWITSRIDFDPTLLCRYAKPESDFYTH